jgi:hypothetical protein
MKMERQKVRKKKASQSVALVFSNTKAAEVVYVTSYITTYGTLKAVQKTVC